MQDDSLSSRFDKSDAWRYSHLQAQQTPTCLRKLYDAMKEPLCEDVDQILLPLQEIVSYLLFNVRSDGAQQRHIRGVIYV